MTNPMDITKFLTAIPRDLIPRGKAIIDTVMQIAGDIHSKTEDERQWWAKFTYKLLVELLVLAKVKNRTEVKTQVRTILNMLFDVTEF